MASTDDVFSYRSGPSIVRRMPVASGTVVYAGDLLKLSSGKVLKMATTTDNLAFCGVAAEQHRSTDPSTTIGVYLPLPMTVFEYALNSATDCTIGDELQWTADQTLKKSATAPIAMAIESRLQASTGLLVMFKLPQHTTGLPLLGKAS